MNARRTSALLLVIGILRSHAPKAKSTFRHSKISVLYLPPADGNDEEAAGQAQEFDHESSVLQLRLYPRLYKGLWQLVGTEVRCLVCHASAVWRKNT
jgi:hypothetical protein